MKYNEQTLSRAIKSGGEFPLCLLYGSEVYLIEKWGKTLMGKEGEGSVKLDGTTPDIDEAWEALGASTLLGDSRRVMLNDFDPGKLNKEDWKVFEGMAADIPDGSRLVITVKSPGFASSAAGKKAIGLVQKYGAIIELNARTGAEQVRFLQSVAKRWGCGLPPGEARHLISICPVDMHILENETAKICAYLDGSEITRPVIDRLVTPKTEANAFDLQRMILKGNIRGGLGLLARLFYLREEPIAILGALSTGFCDIYRARVAMGAGQSAGAFAKQYGYKSEYRAKKAFENAGGLSISAVRRAVLLISESELAMKTKGTDNKIRLEQLTLNLAIICGEGH